MDGDKNVTATFTEDEYTLTVNVVGSGSVTKDPDQATYAYGTDVLLTAVAAEGWEFAGWSGDASGTDNPTTVDIIGNMEVTATFAEVVISDALYLVVKGTDNFVYYRAYNGSDWSEWAGIPASDTLYEPAAAVYQGKLHIAIVGTEYFAIYWGSLDLETLEFSGFTWIPGASDSTPALTA